MLPLLGALCRRVHITCYYLIPSSHCRTQPTQRFAFPIVIVLLSLLSACSSGGGGGGGNSNPNVPLVDLAAVQAFFGINGKDWNDYVQGVDLKTATDTACVAATDAACIHAGEVRIVEAKGKTSCAGLTAADALNAFHWICDDSSGVARFISTGLNDGKHLSTLIDFANTAWKSNKVTVYVNGQAWGATPMSVWWDNLVDNANVNADVNFGAFLLNSEKTIYVLSNSFTLPNDFHYEILASKVGFVIAPDAVLHADDLMSADPIVVSNLDFIWLEGNVKGNINVSYEIDLSNVRFSRLDNIFVSNGDRGIDLYKSSHNLFTNIKASNHSTIGIDIRNESHHNLLFGLTLSDNDDIGLSIASLLAPTGSDNNVILSLTATNNSSSGIEFNSNTNSNLLVAATITNSYAPISIYQATNSTIVGGLTANGFDGIWFEQSTNTTFSDLTDSNNTQYGVYSINNTNTIFLNEVQLGNNSTSDCFVDVAVDGTCSVVTSSNSANLTQSDTITTANSFVGKVLVDDKTNASDKGTTSTSFPPDTNALAAFDWTHFANPFRAWGIEDGLDFPSATQQGQWNLGEGRIWDWSLSVGDTMVLNKLSYPSTNAGNNTLTQVWTTSGATDTAMCKAEVPGSVWNTDHCETIFLNHAIEITNDGIGNNNGLCESGETCLYTPNMGSYQGSGKLISAGDFVDGAILTGITLLKYQNNGVN